MPTNKKVCVINLIAVLCEFNVDNRHKDDNGDVDDSKYKIAT